MHSVKEELIETVRELVAANPGQCSEKEYLSILDTLIRKAPCNSLVFGGATPGCGQKRATMAIPCLSNIIRIGLKPVRSIVLIKTKSNIH